MQDRDAEWKLNNPGDARELAIDDKERNRINNIAHAKLFQFILQLLQDLQ